MGWRAMSSSTMGSKAWRPGVRVVRARANRRRRGSRRHTASGRARSGEARRSRRSASNPTRCIPGDSPALSETTSRSSATRQARMARDDPARRGRPPCRMAGRAWTGGATRPGTGRRRRAGRTASTAASTSRPNSTTPRLKLDAATATAPWLADECLDARTVRAPAGGRDDEGPATGLERGGQIGDDGVAARCLDDHARAGEVAPVVSFADRPPDQSNGPRRSLGIGCVACECSASTARPSAPSPRMSIVSMSLSLPY